MKKHNSWEHVRWIGGSPCAGKSTIAKQLASTYDLILYHCDDHWDRHSNDSPPHTTLYQLGQMSPEDLFLRSPEEQLSTEIVCYQEEFIHILSDLAKLPRDKIILAEGAALQPDLVFPVISQLEHAIWIVPTKKFQLQEYAKREWAHSITVQTSNPQQAFDSWMERDIQYAEWIYGRANHLNLSSIVVDGSQSIQQNYEIVRAQFNL